MGRWEPDAYGRLQRSALELFTEHGFDATTVLQIAERAGLTKRTFFRHFADKREILFAGAGEMTAAYVRAIETAPDSASDLDVVTRALDAGAVMIESHQGFARTRAAVVAANPELLEREQLKRTSNVVAISGALERRGTPAVAARLTAEAAAAVFGIAYTQWAADRTGRSLSLFIRDGLAELKQVTAAW